MFRVFLSPGEHEAIAAALHAADFAVCCAEPLSNNDDAGAMDADRAALDAADAAVLVLPRSGRYAKLLASCAIAAGKPVAVLAGGDFKAGRSDRWPNLEFVPDIAGLVAMLERWRQLSARRVLH
jgi:hypothetical protein